MAAFVLFDAASTTFAVPASDVVRVIRMAAIAPVPGAPPFIRGVLNIHGMLVPVVNVRARLGGAPCPLRLEDQLLLVRSGERLLALEVDRVRDLVDAPAPPLDGSGWTEATPFLAGALAVPGGAVVVQSVEAWMASAEGAVPA